MMSILSPVLALCQSSLQVENEGGAAREQKAQGHGIQHGGGKGTSVSCCGGLVNLDSEGGEAEAWASKGFADWPCAGYVNRLDNNEFGLITGPWTLQWRKVKAVSHNGNDKAKPAGSP
eukprot:1193335-Prorocentrum_minimum.AAC.2